jgi:starch phosphorylase
MMSWEGSIAAEGKTPWARRTHEGFARDPRIAYFSMEIALRSDIPTYSGGLGVLAGDTMRSAADLELPLVGVTLASRSGYFRQEIVQGRQVEHPDQWDPAQWCQRLPARVAVRIAERQVWIGAWLYQVESGVGRPIPVILLDTDLADNDPVDREITHRLYGDDAAYRLKQEIVLGIGGVRMLAALSVEVGKYHLNEGHAAFLTLELLRREGSRDSDADRQQQVAAVRSRCVFTTHTPVEAGHDQFDYELAEPLLADFTDGARLRALAGPGRLNMTRLALNLSEHVNGVARRHAEVSRRMFPGYEVRAITNGVHPRTWASDSFRRLFDKHLPNWCHEPERLMHADLIADDAIRAAHADAKGKLAAEIARCMGRPLDAELPWIGFARRMTRYKRPELLFSDLDRLREVARAHPFAVVLAGKAHPMDVEGKQSIERLHVIARELEGAVPVVFLPGYDMALARLLVSGVDVWLNTPQRPLEASGTSGMKAALNGVPSLSVPDGWWLEGCIEGVTGWAVGADAEDDNARDGESLYRKLQEVVLPLYHRDRPGWMRVMKGAIARNAPFFNSHRMMRRYATEAYLR